MSTCSISAGRTISTRTARISGVSSTTRLELASTCCSHQPTIEVHSLMAPRPTSSALHDHIRHVQTFGQTLKSGYGLVRPVYEVGFMGSVLKPALARHVTRTGNRVVQNRLYTSTRVSLRVSGVRVKVKDSDGYIRWTV